MKKPRKLEAGQMQPDRAAAVLREWHGLGIEAASAAVAAADFSRVNRLAGAAADDQHTFWDNPSDLRTLLEGGE